MNSSDLWSYHEAARWFGGKGRGGRLVGVQPLDWLGDGPDAGGPAVRPEISTVSYPDGSSEQYQLLLAYRPEPGPGHIGPAADPALGHVHDATADPEALRVLLTAMLDACETPTYGATLNSRGGLDPDLAIRVFTGTQSNTNLLVGDVAILKLFRKLEPGRNLDIEIHDALGRAGVSSVASLFGWLTGDFTGADAQPTSADLAMLVEQFKDVRDGWEFALEHARSGADFTEHAAALGQALHDIHAALADTFPGQTLEGSDLSAQMAARLPAAVEAAPALASYQDALLGLFARLNGQQLAAQRVHGDFHLGQTLLTAGGWRIIDFEGEPMKTMAERRMPDSRWRDVAGMVRSFGYATSGFADPTGTIAQAWLHNVTTAFLTQYAGALTESERLTLSAYIADKAVYEVVYEARNRPDWIAIPLTALDSITGAGATTFDSELTKEK